MSLKFHFKAAVWWEKSWSGWVEVVAMISVEYAQIRTAEGASGGFVEVMGKAQAFIKGEVGDAQGDYMLICGFRRYN